MAYLVNSQELNAFALFRGHANFPNIPFYCFFLDLLLVTPRTARMVADWFRPDLR